MVENSANDFLQFQEFSLQDEVERDRQVVDQPEADPDVRRQHPEAARHLPRGEAEQGRTPVLRALNPAIREFSEVFVFLTRTVMI